MGEPGVEKSMSISEQALFLLDTATSSQKSRRAEIFLNLDYLVLNSLTNDAPILPATPAALEPMNQFPFSVASRLARTNNEDQVRAEALVNALKKLRNRANATSAFKNQRVVRNT